MEQSSNYMTVLGASGFIGSHLAKNLRALGANVLAPARGAKLSGKDLGHVIYCIGLTSDFRSRPIDTVDAHVCRLLTVLRDCKFASLLYLSSTRLYNFHLKVATEEEPIQVSSLNPNDLYNISKLMGESLALCSGKKVRIARISNVYGGDFTSENFLSSIIREAVTTGKIVLHTSPDSEKDYICIDDVVDGLIRIARDGRHNIYNLASGANVSNHDLVERLKQITNCEVAFLSNATRLRFPSISVGRMRGEFSFGPSGVLEDLEGIVNVYRRQLGSTNDQD